MLSGVFLLYSVLIFPEEIVRLIPPTINPKTIALKYSCIRPGHDDGITISMEKNGSKKVVNNYGHGGSGWATLFGSVQEAIDLFTTEMPNKKTPIRIIGSGCIGLTTAIELSRLGYNVVGIYTKSLYDMASWRAAGFFGSFPGKNQAALMPLAVKTFSTYRNIEKGDHLYISKDAVELLPIYCTLETENEVAFLADYGLVPPKEPVSLEFDNGIKHEGFFKFMTYFMNTGIIMKELLEEVSNRGIPIEIREVHSYEDITEPVVFNCSGLGSRELNQDLKVNAIYGHLIALDKGAGQNRMDYMILTSVQQNGKNELLYVVPKSIVVTPENPTGVPCFGVVGVTIIPHVEKFSSEQLSELDRVEFEKILERASSFFSGRTFNSSGS